jgi:hypothetical protein
MKKSTNGDVVATHSQATYGGYTFVYRGVRPGIDFLHVFMLIPCPKTGCNASGGPSIPEAQWVIRVVPAPSPYPATLTMQHGLTFSSVTRALDGRWTATRHGLGRWIALLRQQGDPRRSLCRRNGEQRDH